VEGAVRGFGFVVPRVEGRQLLAATWSSLKWANRAPSSQVLVRCYLGGVAREAVLEGDDATLVHVVRQELRDMAGVAAEPRYVEVNRWWQGMPQYTVGHLERLQSIESALADCQGLFLAGAAYRGIGIPDCVKDGTDTATKFVQSLEHRV
jgi:protoporphyrinogen/coproporphyrinogen III oxidase